MSTSESPPLGQREKYVSHTSQLPLEGRFFYLQFLTEVTNDVISATRDFFSKNPRVPAFFRWVGKAANELGQETDIVNTKIHIAQEQNDNENFYPSVLVAGASAQLQDLWLNHQLVKKITVKNPRYNVNVAIQDQLEAPEIEVGERLAGKLTHQITMRVRGKTPAGTDQIMDVLIHGLVGPLRRQLEQKMNYAWIPNSGRISDLSREEYTAKHPIHVRTVTFSLMAEWADDFFYNDVTVDGVEPLPIRDVSNIGL